ncbi:hypothetical protein PUNSTDRAFT_132467 [Punctularia strigosozonata HHB-11173 SS5]|uniref:uncharacterized protein n=1 Tax=Punctularia strigosozonata (strain HHB-11173) TaxID=741275 RepID=UPI0004416F39|nr:uncharacterized protein PUNSTDRAFT_132467 [Punctularia strigosozonata HHB-11173 SS5]EIN10372.1 hypothetical protein PUNSTDRAFT_132467 [Punctularia strigosozonata HHB-11173 SS5]
MAEPSSSATPTDPATERYRRQVLPYALAGVAPGLSAYFAMKYSYDSNPDTASDAQSRCRKCGFYLWDGSATVRSVRSRSKSKSKDATGTVQRSILMHCDSCDFEQRYACKPCAPSYPRVKKARHAPASLHATDDTVLPAQKRNKNNAGHDALTVPESKQGAVRPSSASPASSIKDKAAQKTTQPPAPVPSISLATKSSTPQRPPTKLPRMPASNSKRPGPTATSSNPASSQARSKKKAGLQEMLARNRERQEKDRKDKGQQGAGGGGLAAFLGEL